MMTTTSKLLLLTMRAGPLPQALTLNPTAGDAASDGDDASCGGPTDSMADGQEGASARCDDADIASARLTPA